MNDTILLPEMFTLHRRYIYNSFVRLLHLKYQRIIFTIYYHLSTMVYTV